MYSYCFPQRRVRLDKKWVSVGLFIDFYFLNIVLSPVFVMVVLNVEGLQESSDPGGNAGPV